MRHLPVIAALLVMTCTGCFTVKVTAPPGQEVYLVAPEKPFQSQRQWRAWYGIYGLTPMDNTMPVDVMKRENFSEVQVVVKDTIPDALISIFYNVVAPIGIVPQTIVIEGNRPPPSVTGKPRSP
jgi:hypothetical protein